jgi:hypothetical protein
MFESDLQRLRRAVRELEQLGESWNLAGAIYTDSVVHGLTFPSVSAGLQARGTTTASGSVWSVSLCRTAASRFRRRLCDVLGIDRRALGRRQRREVGAELDRAVREALAPR